MRTSLMVGACGAARRLERGMRKVSPILRSHVGAGVHQAGRDLRRRRDRLGRRQERPSRQRRPGARALGRGVLHLRAGAALSHHRADRLRAARRTPAARLLRADDRRDRTGLRQPARRRPRGAGAVAGPSVRAITASFGNAVQIGIPLAAALYGETGLALHVTRRQPALADAADGPDRAGRARPGARAAPRRSGQGPPGRGCWP